MYRKTIRVAPIMDSDHELDVCDEFAVDSDECDLDADASDQYPIDSNEPDHDLAECETSLDRVSH